MVEKINQPGSLSRESLRESVLRQRAYAIAEREAARIMMEIGHDREKPIRPADLHNALAGAIHRAIGEERKAHAEDMALLDHWLKVRVEEGAMLKPATMVVDTRQREADELSKIGPTVEIANLARLVLENGWGEIIKKDDHHPEDQRFAERRLCEFMGRNGLYRAVVHISQPLGAIQITPKGLQVRAAVEALEKARKDA